MLPQLIEHIGKVAYAVAATHGGEDNKFAELLLNPVTEKDTIKVQNKYDNSFVMHRSVSFEFTCIQMITSDN